METIFSEDVLKDKDAEHFEFNLGRAQELRCSQAIKDRNCGTCESCLITQAVTSTKEWFWRCSHVVQKKFLMGLVQRFHSVDLLKYVVQLLKPCLAKDFTYARNRVTPSLETDQIFSSSQRALSPEIIDHNIKQTWTWFVSRNYWTKSNFMMGIFRCCDIAILFIVGNQAKTLLAAEVKALASRDAYTNSRVTSAAVTSRYASPSPTATSRGQSWVRSAAEMISPLPKGFVVLDSGEIYNDDSGDESDDDPTLYILPTSDKASSGVTRYRDFIRELPVHLSKCILGYLDEACLVSCRKVSKNWAVLVGEMRKEFYANQQMWEDIMLMQGSSGVNPNYANDIDILVPNIAADTKACIRLTGKDEKIEKDSRFKSEMNFENAYTGYSTRKVIMEERNLYCGSYNVLVLVNEHNKDRVIHKCGGNLLACSNGRRCHLIDISTGRDTEKPIAGHSGSIHCVHIQEDEGFVLTGSYDTSIRKWDLETVKCVKIFNGHQDTVVALDYCNKTKQFASASLDRSCKVWNINSKKCWRTFKHRGKVLAVTLGVTQCLTGCEQGRVKVWDLASGKLIKMLLGHEGPITAIRFDKWHIMTAAQDGYALSWSNQGNHKRCLTALRHPCPVLCMEFQYLRVITGAEDGRVRIWNVVNGQCCRIMRGNSQSDPVLSIHAIGDRLTINTKTNVLMLSFENIEWDYSNESDKVVSLVDTNKYPDAPLKNHSYAYIRAQRMARVASADPRLISKTGKARFRAQSAKSTVSGKSLGETIYGRSASPTNLHTEQIEKQLRLDGEPQVFEDRKSPVNMMGSTFLRKASSATDIAESTPPYLDKRRVSWAFEHPAIPDCEEPNLGDMKALLKQQIRNRVVTPDFIYLTVSALKKESQKLTGGCTPTKQAFNPAQSPTKRILKSRPSSSPSAIDSKTKVRIADSVFSEFLDEAQQGDTRSVKSIRTSHSARSGTVPTSPVIRRTQSADIVKRNQSADHSWRSRTAQKLNKSKGKGLSSTATEINLVPMLMYPKEGLRPSVNMERVKKWPSTETIANNHPLNSTGGMKLRTYTQETNFMTELQSSKPVVEPTKERRPKSCKY